MTTRMRRTVAIRPHDQERLAGQLVRSRCCVARCGGSPPASARTAGRSTDLEHRSPALPSGTRPSTTAWPAAPASAAMAAIVRKTPMAMETTCSTANERLGGDGQRRLGRPRRSDVPASFIRPLRSTLCAKATPEWRQVQLYPSPIPPDGEGASSLRRVPRGAHPLGQRRRHERVEVAVKHALGVGRLHLGAQVLDHLVRLQDVAADLVAPADVGLGVLQRGLGLLAASAARAS